MEWLKGGPLQKKDGSGHIWTQTGKMASGKLLK